MSRKAEAIEQTESQRQERARQCRSEIEAACERFNCQLVAHVQIVGSQLNSAVVVHAK